MFDGGGERAVDALHLKKMLAVFILGCVHVCVCVVLIFGSSTLVRV